MAIYSSVGLLRTPYNGPHYFISLVYLRIVSVKCQLIYLVTYVKYVIIYIKLVLITEIAIIGIIEGATCGFKIKNYIYKLFKYFIAYHVF